MPLVERILVLSVNTEGMQVEILLDKPVAEARPLMGEDATGRLCIPLRRLSPSRGAPREHPDVATAATIGDLTVRELGERDHRDTAQRRSYHPSQARPPRARAAIQKSIQKLGVCGAAKVDLWGGNRCASG